MEKRKKLRNQRVIIFHSKTTIGIGWRKETRSKFGLTRWNQIDKLSKTHPFRATFEANFGGVIGSTLKIQRLVSNYITGFWLWCDCDFVHYWKKRWFFWDKNRLKLGWRETRQGKVLWVGGNWLWLWLRHDNSFRMYKNKKWWFETLKIVYN